MPSYKYKLQNLLDLKITIEDEKKNQFGLAVKRLENENLKLQEIMQDMEAMRIQLEQKSSEGIKADNLKIISDYMTYYKNSIKRQKLMIKMAEDYLNDCRAELIKATQEKKMMEKLKEIDHTKYLYEEQKIEEKIVDDLVSFKKSMKQ